MESTFTNIYENKIWGDNENNNYSGSSGPGSDIENNKKYIELLKNIINEYNIKNIVDLGCGDFRIGKLLYDDLNIIYTGYDTYKKVIDYNITQYPEQKYNFKHLDFYTNKESIVEGDMCILKDVIQHWSLKEIYIFLDYLTESKKFKYILLINCCNQKKDNEDCVIGDWRQLSCNFLPLKKYNAIKMYNYNSKEISIILPFRN
jgi:hypothetical protein